MLLKMLTKFTVKKMEVSIYKKTQELAPMRSAMVRALDDAAIGNTVKMSVAKAFADSGQKPTKEDVNYIVPALINEVKRHFPNIRIDEIPIAINNGILGHYGEYFGINVVSFMKFIRAYYSSQERAQMAIAALPVPEEKPQPTEQEILAAEKQMISDAFASYRQNGYYLDIANHVYNKLNGRGLIQFTAQRKKEFYEQARLELLQDNHNSLRGSIAERNKMKTLVSGLMANEGDAVNKITRRAKQIALNAYFNELQEMEIDILEQL